MKIRKVASLGLAVALQVLPITRVFVASTSATGSSFAIVSTWIAGALALMGGVDAVSGASSILISPATGTTGVPYSGVVQYSGSHASSARSWELKNNWSGAKSGCNTVYEIAPGIWLTNSATYLVRVGGTPTTSGTFSFTLKIYDSTGCSGGNSDTRSASITIAAGAVTAPSITTQPVSQTVTAGANVSFTVAASGTAPLSYQWKQNGANLSGATSATLSLPGVTTGQAGTYSCVVTNGAGSATSSAATLTVNAAAIAPSITTQPVSQSVIAGANVSFTVAASGTAPLSYQWQWNGANLGGATSATLSLPGVTTGQAGTYSCVVTNGAGSATSSAATLTVNAAAIAPSITTQPVSQSVIAGANVSFTVAASGPAPLSYQWQWNGANLGGATSATLSLPSVAIGQAGSYTCVVTNSAGSATSSAATLTVNAPVIVAPGITTQPVSQSVIAGANVSFTVGASGPAPLSYQWQWNGANLGGATSATLSLPSVAIGQAGSYTCVVTNSAGSATSSAATLTVNALVIVAPGITTQPVSQTVTAGANVNFTVAASGPAPLSYQWQWNGANLGGATSATLSLPSVTTNLAGTYTCVVTNVAGSATSSGATLTVQASFGPPPYTAGAGTYNGLFFESDEVRLSSAGAFKVNFDGSGNYSGWLQLGYARYAYSGKLDLNLRATNVIPRWNSNPLTVELLVGQGDQAGQVSGRVTDGVWNSPLSGGRATGNSPYAGKYTLIIPGLVGDARIPAGDGYATLSVGVDGLATMNGMLADGSKFMQTAFVTDEGDWPVYVSLYSAKGAVVSWLSFTNLSGSDVSGTLVWIKQAGASATSYPAGFTNETKAEGSLYVAAAAAGKVLNLSAAVVDFSGGELAADFNNTVSVNAGSSVVNLSPNALTLTISAALGSFTGQVQDPGTGGAAHNFGGVVLQKQNAGYGFMTGVNASSRVSFTAP